MIQRSVSHPHDHHFIRKGPELVQTVLRIVFLHSNLLNVVPFELKQVGLFLLYLLLPQLDLFCELIPHVDFHSHGPFRIWAYLFACLH